MTRGSGKMIPFSGRLAWVVLLCLLATGCDDLETLWQHWKKQLPAEPVMDVSFVAVQMNQPLPHRLAELQAEVQRHRTSLEKLMEEASEEALEQARQQHRKLLLAAYRLYPWLLMTARIDPQANALLQRLWTYPIEPGYLDYLSGYPAGGLVFDDAVALSGEALRQQHQFSSPDEATLGFFVVDFLLQGEAGSRPADDFLPIATWGAEDRAIPVSHHPNNRRRRLLELACDQLYQDLAQLQNLLSEEGAYRQYQQSLDADDFTRDALQLFQDVLVHDEAISLALLEENRTGLSDDFVAAIFRVQQDFFAEVLTAEEAGETDFITAISGVSAPAAEALQQALVGWQADLQDFGNRLDRAILAGHYQSLARALAQWQAVVLPRENN